MGAWLGATDLRCELVGSMKSVGATPFEVLATALSSQTLLLLRLLNYRVTNDLKRFLSLQSQACRPQFPARTQPPPTKRCVLILLQHWGAAKPRLAGD